MKTEPIFNEELSDDGGNAQDEDNDFITISDSGNPVKCEMNTGVINGGTINDDTEAPSSTTTFSDNLDYANDNDEEEFQPGSSTGQIEIEDVKPVSIPIPELIPETDSDVKKKQEIIVTYRCKKKPVLQDRVYLCTICNSGFPNVNLFHEHIEKFHINQYPYKCRHCGKRFSKAYARTKHETIHNKNRYRGEPKFSCDICGKAYHLRTGLHTHRKIQHFGYKPPVRRRSSKIVKEHHSTSGVRNHRNIPKPKRIYKCPHCDLKYEMRCLLNSHMSVHSSERKYECEICGQRLSSKKTLRSHIKNRHTNRTERSMPTYPDAFKNQPFACNYCGKIFRVMSQLQRHIYIHTGEKPHECATCKKRFRLQQDLAGHIKRFHTEKNAAFYNRLYKCLICGQDGFIKFSDLRNHRLSRHRHIPYNSEKEKPYGCSVCGKPYFTKIHAIICTLLKHDPTSLQKAMFKIKCPQCPPERFGYHNALALHRHWMAEHPELPFPNVYRSACGMYEKGSVIKTKEHELPSVVLNTVEVKNITENGPPPVKYEFPLYTEFDLIPVETVFYSRNLNKTCIERKLSNHKSRASTKFYNCTFCKATFTNSWNFQRHQMKHEKVKLLPPKKIFKCDPCQMRFTNEDRYHSHQRQHLLMNAVGTILPKRPVGRPLNPNPTNKSKPTPHSQLAWPYHCNFCGEGFRKVAALRRHANLAHNVGSKSTRPIGRPRKASKSVKKSTTSEDAIPGIGYSNGETKRKPGRPRKRAVVDASQHSLVVAEEEKLKENAPSSVNINDNAGIRQLLGNRSVSINLWRICRIMKIFPNSFKSLK